MKVNSCGFVIEYNKKYLLVKSYGSAHIWGIPKGKREEGETQLEAALRETFEECGLDLSGRKHALLGEYSNKKKRFTVFYCKIDKALFNFPLKCLSYLDEDETKPEVDAFVWVDRNTAKTLTVGKHSHYIFDELLDKVPELV